jgi:hypothetical protein
MVRLEAEQQAEVRLQASDPGLGVPMAEINRADGGIRADKGGACETDVAETAYRRPGRRR